MYQPRAYPPRQPDPAGYRTGGHELRQKDIVAKESVPTDTTRGKANPGIDIVRSRPQATSSRRNSRSLSNPRSNSRANMYSSENIVRGERVSDDPSAAQLQEMREKSKILREQVLSAQRTVQTKEGQLQRLRNERLPSDEVKQESEKLTRLQDRISVQEARLRKLRETKSKIQQQVIINSNMTAELDEMRNVLSNKEREIGEIDQLINQLNTRLQQAKIERANKNSKNSHYLNRIEKLKQEMLAHKRVTEAVQGKFSSQREAVQSKKEETSKVDRQISELWKKLQQAKAAHQQNAMKPATAIAAVVPFEHKPSNNETSPDDLSLPTKPHEIDIKLVERNGGSGQSSPSFSADEREPYSNRIVKPAPMVPPVTRQEPNKSSEGARPDRLRSQDGSRSQQGSTRVRQEQPRDSLQEALNRSDAVIGQPSVQPVIHSSSSDSSLPSLNGQQKQYASVRGADLPNQRVVSPSLRVSSPSLRVASPNSKVSSPKNDAEEEMKLEKGPVRQFKQVNHTKMTHSFSDSNISSIKPKNFNAKPRPFGAVAEPSPPMSPNPDKGSGSSQLINNSSQQKDINNQSERTIYRPTPISKKEDSLRGGDGGTPYARAYPAAPIMGRQQLNSSSNQSVSNTSTSRNGSSQSENVHQNNESQQRTQSPRYATRSQISDTYIQQVDKEKLEKYRREMEKAVRDISINKNDPDAGTPIKKEETTPDKKQSSTLPPPLDLQGANNMNPSLMVLAPQAINGVTNFSSDILSSEEEPTGDRLVVIYNPADTDSSKPRPKSIIKKAGVDKTDGGNPRMDNARFHPLVILLDTALNGTVDEVESILSKVPDPSASNDEGITALHNAICAGHLDIVQTLVEFGVDVNAVDTDGWTPLHCAASCNNQPVVEYLLSRGACILATTHSDSETAREKCEMDEEGYDGTSKCLYNMEMKLGVDDSVYCVYDYEAQIPDELTLHVNDKVTVLRRGDKDEQEWWWAKCGDKEGYVAKNLLAFTPRVLPSKPLGLGS